MKIKTLYEHQVLHLLYVEHDKVLLDVDTENILDKKTDKLFVVLSNPCQGMSIYGYILIIVCIRSSKHATNKYFMY